MLLYFILGIILGILSKYGDVAYSNSIFYYFGLVSSGLMLWLFIYVFIIIRSKCKRNCLINIFILMLSMFISYYLFSYFYVHYIYKRIILFWIGILLISIFGVSFVYNIRYSKLFRFGYVILSIICIIIDALYVNGVSIFIVLIELVIMYIGMRLLNGYR